MNRKKSKPEVYVMDIRYSNSYNPELVKPGKREFRYIVDGEGKEKLVVYEEKDELEQDERQ